MKTNLMSLLIISPLLFLIAGGALNLTGQEPPDGPPDITPPPLPEVEPFPLGNVVIPPFNASDPGSSVLAEGQKAELRVVTSLTGSAGIQWLKDNEELSGESGTSLILKHVDFNDAGTYQVVVDFGNSSISSMTETFEVFHQAEIDDIFTSWTNRFFSLEEQTTSEIAAKTADPDFDGLSNLVEYFFGLSPLSPQNTPRIDIIHFEDSKLEFSYPRARERSDLMLRIEGSNSLKNWLSLSINKISITPLDATTENVEIDVNWPLDPPYPRFLRLAIEQQDP